MSMSDPFLPVSDPGDLPRVPDEDESEIDIERDLDVESDVDGDDDEEDEYDFSSRENFFRPPTPGDRLDDDELEDDLDDE